MIPVSQTIVHPTDGNCFQACLASVLEQPLGSIPHFLRLYGQPLMLPKARAWLTENFGLSLLTVNVQGINRTRILRPFTPGSLVLVSGQSHTFEEATHVVVGRITNDVNDYELVHDPNPGGLGLKGEPFYYYYFVAVDPAKFVNGW